jgi:hypothetical protein
MALKLKTLRSKEFGDKSVVALHDISNTEASDFEQYGNIIIACPT